MSLNPSKYIFGITQGKILSHIVSNSRINVDPERVTAILNLLAPTSKKEIQSFMGRISFVRICFHNFIVMVKPFHNMLKKDQYFSCKEDVKKYCVGIKKEINSALVLAKPDFNKDFTIYTIST
jgi:hypothetical protein